MAFPHQNMTSRHTAENRAVDISGCDANRSRAPGDFDTCLARCKAAEAEYLAADAENGDIYGKLAEASAQEPQVRPWYRTLSSFVAHKETFYSSREIDEHYDSEIARLTCFASFATEVHRDRIQAEIEKFRAEMHGALRADEARCAGIAERIGYNASEDRVNRAVDELVLSLADLLACRIRNLPEASRLAAWIVDVPHHAEAVEREIPAVLRMIACAEVGVS